MSIKDEEEEEEEEEEVGGGGGREGEEVAAAAIHTHTTDRILFYSIIPSPFLIPPTTGIQINTHSSKIYMGVCSFYDSNPLMHDFA